MAYGFTLLSVSSRLMAARISCHWTTTEYTTIVGRVGRGVRHLGHDEAMEAGGREFSLQPPWRSG